jgi:hypothetical protein
MSVSLKLGKAAQRVTLAWDTKFQPCIAGYKVYPGMTSISLSKTVDFRDGTTTAASALNVGSAYVSAAASGWFKRVHSRNAGEAFLLTIPAANDPFNH